MWSALTVGCHGVVGFSSVVYSSGFATVKIWVQIPVTVCSCCEYEFLTFIHKQKQAYHLYVCVCARARVRARVHVWWYVCDGTYVMVRVWWYVCDGTCVMVRVWWYVCDGTCVMVRVGWYMCDGTCVMVYNTCFNRSKMIQTKKEAKISIDLYITDAACQPYNFLTAKRNTIEFKH